MMLVLVRVAVFFRVGHVDRLHLFVFNFDGDFDSVLDLCCNFFLDFHGNSLIDLDEFISLPLPHAVSLHDCFGDDFLLWLHNGLLHLLCLRLPDGLLLCAVAVFVVDVALCVRVRLAFIFVRVGELICSIVFISVI